jgi:glucuronate isomerase
MMRALGYDEYYCTGGATPYEKFMAWAKTVQNLIGNPIYPWCHMELQRYFGITEVINEKTAPAIWEKANAILKTPELSVKGIFEKFKVYAVGTTDDPTDTLEHHRAIVDGTAPIGKLATKVVPSFRPDMALDISQKTFAAYIKKLSDVSGMEIKSSDGVLAALEKRLDFFVSLGCQASDHALETAPFVVSSDSQIDKTFTDVMAGKEVSREEMDAYRTKIMCGLAKLYADRNIVMQIHLSARRNINSRMFQMIGPNSGFNVINDQDLSGNLAQLLNRMEGTGAKSGLPKTVLFTLNPKDYHPLVTIMGSFMDNCAKQENRNGIVGKMQLGTAWWFCDHKDGMEEQMRILAYAGNISTFVGMLTDSANPFSFPRHEYFRRILCNLMGNWVESGEFPNDKELLEKLVKDICFENAKNYLS